MLRIPNFREFNIADWFSFYRILVAPILLLLIIIDFREIFAWLLLISYSTDAIDGFLARRLNISSSRGSQLDSIGDQTTLVIALIAIVVFETKFMMENLLLILIAFVPYIVQMIIAFRKYGKATAFHTYLAKLSAVIQAVFILWLLFYGPVYWLFYTMIAIGVIETIEEITLIYLYDNWVDRVKGIYWALRDERRIVENKTNS